MDVDKRLAVSVAFYDQALDEVDVDAALARTLAVLRALDGHSSANTHEVPSVRHPAAGRASAHHPEAREGQGNERVLRELAARRLRAVEGDAWSCRRTAELLELLERDEEATQWWRRAADAGDLDAQEYVKECLDN